VFALLAFFTTASAQNAIKATTTLHDDGGRTELVNDPMERIGTATTYDGAGKLRQKAVYQLDGASQPVSGVFYDAKGKVVLKAVYRRDASNRLGESFEYAPNDKLIRRLVYEYGAGDKIKNIRAYDANGTEIPNAKKR